MSYSLRNKKKVHHGGPAGDVADEPTKEKRTAVKHSVPQPDQSNSSKEDKTNVTKQRELKTTITKTPLVTEVGNPLKLLPSTDLKHSNNGDEATEKTKKESKKVLRYDSFIYKEDDDKFYLYHKYWRIPYRGNDLFQCPKCRQSVKLQLKVGFVMVSDKSWHKKNCVVCEKVAPQKGHLVKVAYQPEQQKGYKFSEKLITKEEVDVKRKSLEAQGYKPIIDPAFHDAISQKEAENNETCGNETEEESL